MPTARRRPGASPSSAGRSTTSFAPMESTGTSRARSISRHRAASKPMPISRRSARGCRKWPTSARRSKAPRGGARPKRARPRPTATWSPRATIGTWRPSITARPNGRTTISASSTSHCIARSANATRNYARLADHKIEAVSIPFKGKSIPGWFHLPPGYGGGKLPVVIAIPGHGQLQGSAASRWPTTAG